MPHAMSDKLRAKPGGRPLIIAHRGGSLEAPENTLASLRHGIGVGSDWQEVDVALTSDLEVVIIHDDTLDRTTSGAGVVAQHSFDQLALLTAGAPAWSAESASMLQTLGIFDLPDFAARFPEERVPRLSEALCLPGANLMIELKTVLNFEALAQAVIKAVREANMEKHVVLASFDPLVLAAASKHEPRLALMGLFEDVQALRTFDAISLDALGVHTKIASEVLKQTCGRLPVWAWTLYTKDTARALADAGVDGLITDIPQQLIAG